MKLKINKKTFNVVEYNTIWEKFKGLKFNLEPLNNIYRFKSKYANTYFLCQKINIIMTDDDNKILYIYKEVKSEKIIFPKRKVKYVYFFPANIGNDFKKGDLLNIKD